MGNVETPGAPARHGFSEWTGFIDQSRAHFHYQDWLWQGGRKIPLAGNELAAGRRTTYAADVIHAAEFLAAQGKVDGDRAVIRGGSAGGYTTLAALTFHPEVFKAGASYYGVSDLEVLALDTHKFESRYPHSLVGPYPAAKATYRARSPIHAIDRLACPLILFQGLDDKVVPPNQSQMVVDAMRAKGLPVAYLAFEGEQHGFRKADTIVRSLEAELYFYGAVFGFRPADRIPPVAIDNLRTSKT